MLRVIKHGRGDPAWNMAVDEALLRHCTVPILRTYGWSVPAVSIGYFQPASVAPAGRPFVRRLTGGGLVDHAADFTYTVVLPCDHPLARAGTAAAYSGLHQAVAHALDSAGIACRLAQECAALDAAACFQRPVRFDVIAPDGNKLAGAAQRRSRQGVLHQGSILVPGLPERFGPLLRAEVASLFGGGGDGDLAPQEDATARELAARRYATDAWNRRR